MADLDVFRRSAQPGEENTWVIISTFDGDGSLRSYAESLKVQLSLKGAHNNQLSHQGDPHYTHRRTLGKIRHGGSIYSTIKRSLERSLNDDVTCSENNE
jgi:hypothetical protein